VTDGGNGTTAMAATTGTITETGTVIAGTLFDSAIGAINLTGASATANRIAALNDINATSFTLNDGVSLAVNGALSVTSGATITDAGTLSVAGSLTAATVSLTAPNIEISGLVSDGGSGTTRLVATTGTIGESGTLIAGTLSGSAAGVADLAGAAAGSNQVAALGNFSAQRLGLSDGSALAINGSVTGGPSTAIASTGSLTVNGSVSGTALTLSAATIAIPGTASDGGSGTTLLVSSAGPITETGTLISGTLSGDAAGSAILTGASATANKVATLGGFQASTGGISQQNTTTPGATGNQFSLTDGTDLLISSTLYAPYITIQAPANQVTLGNGAQIITGGSARAAGAINPAAEPANGGPGAFIQAASFTQVGTSTVLGQGTTSESSTAPATVQISVTGNIQFDPPLGLNASSTWLILNLTNGTAAGNVAVSALDLSYTVPGSASLLGSIGGVSSGSAATFASILPAVNNNYTFNSCVIASAVCQPATPGGTSPGGGATPGSGTSPGGATTPGGTTTPGGITTSPGGTTTPGQTTTGQTPPSQSLDDQSPQFQTAGLAGLTPFLPGQPEPQLVLPNLVVIAVPMLPAPARQLTDPDVMPPNISFLDY